MSVPKKVIHVAGKPEGYGIGTLLYHLLQHQVRCQKHLEVGLVFHKDGPRLDKFQELGIPIHSLGLRTARDIRSVHKFYKLFKEYDLVTLHTHSPLAFLAAVLSRKRVVFMFHGALGLRQVFGIPITTLYMRYLFSKKCDFFTFASNASYKHFKNGFNNLEVSHQKKRIFPYGLNVRGIKARTDKGIIENELRTNGRFVIGTAVRMVPVKRPDLLLRGFAKLRQLDKCSLLLIGEGRKDYQEYLISLRNTLALTENVHFLGYRANAIDLINSFDVFVFPSRREAFGLALLEAMSLGIPCIAFSDGGGAVEILGDSGFVVSDVKELAAAIEKLRGDARLREQKGKEAKLRAKEFDISKAYEYHPK